MTSAWPKRRARTATCAEIWDALLPGGQGETFDSAGVSRAPSATTCRGPQRRLRRRSRLRPGLPAACRCSDDTGGRLSRARPGRRLCALRSALANAAAHGLAVRALAVTSLQDPAVVAALAERLAQGPPALIVNTTAFSARLADGATVLDRAGVPVLQAPLALATRDARAASPRGLGATDLAMNVVLPEVDGRIPRRRCRSRATASASRNWSLRGRSTSPTPPASPTSPTSPWPGHGWPRSRMRTSGWRW